MSIDREESLFLTVSENHRRREYPEYICLMSDPYRNAGGMIAAYEGAMLGGADKLFGLEELNLWLRRHRYAAFDMHTLVPITRICLEYAVRCALVNERPGIAGMAEQAAHEILDRDPLQMRFSSRGWIRIYWLTVQFPNAATEESREILRNFIGFDEALDLFVELVRGSSACTDARSLVEQAVLLYKKVFTRWFAPDHSRDEVPWAEAFEDDLWEGDHTLPDPDNAPEPDETLQELT